MFLKIKTSDLSVLLHFLVSKVEFYLEKLKNVIAPTIYLNL